MPTIEISETTLEKIKDQLGEEIQIKEIENLNDLIGQVYLFQCARYIYHGEVKKVTSDYIELKNASVIFETGAYDNKEAQDKQALPKNCFIMRQSIEAFYKMKW